MGFCDDGFVTVTVAAHACQECHEYVIGRVACGLYISLRRFSINESFVALVVVAPSVGQQWHVCHNMHGWMSAEVVVSKQLRSDWLKMK